MHSSSSMDTSKSLDPSPQEHDSREIARFDEPVSTMTWYSEYFALEFAATAMSTT